MTVCRGTRAGPLPNRERVTLRGGDGFRGDRRVRVGGHGARGAVEQDHCPGGNGVEPVDRHHARNPELAGDDRGMAGRTAQGGDQTDHELRVQARGVGGRQILGTEDRRDIR